MILPDWRTVPRKKALAATAKKNGSKAKSNPVLQKLSQLQEGNRKNAALVKTSVGGRQIPYTGDRTPLGLLI